MLGGTVISNVLGAAPPRDAPTDELKGFIRAACNVAGLKLLLIDPDEKTPLDMRTKPARKKADDAAREEARAAGRKNWLKARSRAGVHLATDDAATVIKYVEAFRKVHGDRAPVNFGVRVAHPLVVADADTPEQRDAFLNQHADGAPVPYTVSSPGALDEDGVTWKHHGGGHWYFINDGEPLPSGRGSGTITAPGGWALIYRDRYVLIPPSVRPEGPYRLTGREYPLPDSMRAVVEAVPPRKERTDITGDLADTISAWAARTSWHDILTPDGWSPEAGRGIDGMCGCPVWTAPGEHGSSRSATAHTSECGLDRYEETDNAPIHIWTDNPGPAIEAAVAKWGKTLTKLQVWAAIQYDCDISAAVVAEELIPDKSFDPSEGRNDISAANMAAKLNVDPNPTAHMANKVDPCVEDEVYDQHESTADATGAAQDAKSDDSSTPPPPTDPPADDDGSDDDDDDEPDGAHHIGDLIVGPFSYWRELPPPEFMIDGLIEQGGLTCVVGPSGVGKSTLVIDWMCSIVTGRSWQGRAVKRQRVLYLPGEGLHGAVQRVRAWERMTGISVDTELLMGNAILQVAAKHEDWSALAAYMVANGVGLLVVDTFARANLGIEENSATEVGKSIERFRKVQEATSAGVMVLHHTTRGTDHGRGSTALAGALDSEVLIKPGDVVRMESAGKPIDMWVTKQKNAAQPDDPILLSMVPFEGSVVIGPADGVLGDPMETVANPARTILPEPRIELAVRIARALERYSEIGLTRVEIANTVAMSPFISTRPVPEKAWKIAITEAVDVALRYGLIRYAANSTAKFRRDVTPFEDARTAAMNDGISD